jgi:hypothetical protein
MTEKLKLAPVILDLLKTLENFEADAEMAIFAYLCAAIVFTEERSNLDGDAIKREIAECLDRIDADDIIAIAKTTFVKVH